MTPVACTRCHAPVPVELLNTDHIAPCPSCQAALQVDVFPALLRPAASAALAPSAVAEGEATCFYHAQKTAHVACDACGRFICALCDIELPGGHWCPTCVESGVRKGNIVTFEQRRVLYDRVALSLALLPVLAWPITIVTAPATLVLTALTWRKPGSLAPRTKVRFVIAALFALATLAAWALGIVWIIRRP